VAADEVNIRMLAEYDAKNPPALDRLLAEGVRLQAFPDDVMTAAYDAAQSLYAETAAGGGGYGEVYDAYRQFQQSADRWFGVAQQAYADFAFSHGNQRIG
jgi:TRAP-type mannitol/chloroaromatic compound transport system substrate-binding protein